jgi:hypothetical protein
MVMNQTAAGTTIAATSSAEDLIHTKPDGSTAQIRKGYA